MKIEPKEFKGTVGKWQTFEISGICMGVESSLRDGIIGYGQVLCNPILPDTDEAYEVEQEEIVSNMTLMAYSKELLICLQSMVHLFDRGLPDGSIGDRQCKEAKLLIDKSLNK